MVECSGSAVSDPVAATVTTIVLLLAVAGTTGKVTASRPGISTVLHEWMEAEVEVGVLCRRRWDGRDGPFV